MADPPIPPGNKLVCDNQQVQMVIENQLLGIETKELTALRKQLGAGPKDELLVVNVDNKNCVRKAVTQGPK